MNCTMPAALLSMLLLVPVHALAKQPVPALAQSLLDRAAEAWEMKEVPNYDVLTDEILDDLALKFAVNAKGEVLSRSEHPEVFTGASPDFDCALPREEAIERAAWYLGRRAPLKQVQGKYVYGMAADGPRMCQAKLKRIEPAGQGSLLKGALLCFESSADDDPKPAGNIEAAIEPEEGSPSGYAVTRLHVVHSQP